MIEQYTVLENSDVDRAFSEGDISDDEMSVLASVLRKVSVNRCKHGMSMGDLYWVVNSRESYADEIRRIIEHNS